MAGLKDTEGVPEEALQVSGRSPAGPACCHQAGGIPESPRIEKRERARHEDEPGEQGEQDLDQFFGQGDCEETERERTHPQAEGILETLRRPSVLPDHP